MYWQLNKINVSLILINKINVSLILSKFWRSGFIFGEDITFFSHAPYPSATATKRGVKDCDRIRSPESTGKHLGLVGPIFVCRALYH